METMTALQIVAIVIGLFILLKFGKFVIKWTIKIAIGAVLIYFACRIFGINLLDYI